MTMFHTAPYLFGIGLVLFVVYLVARWLGVFG